MPKSPKEIVVTMPSIFRDLGIPVGELTEADFNAMALDDDFDEVIEDDEEEDS